MSRVVLVLLLAAVARARPEYPARIPNGAAGAPGASTGITCEHLGHVGCMAGAPRNQFGLDFAAAGRRWTKELCRKDSDGDGVTNGEELGDPCCTWTSDGGADELRMDMLSHPGERGEDGAKSAPKCAAMPAASPAAGASVAPGAATGAAAASSPAAAATATPESTATVSSTVTATPAADDGDDAACFPGSATVQLESGAVKTMAELALGDRVLVARGHFSDVFMFTHSVPSAVHDFVKISTASGAQLTVTKGHYVYVNGALAVAGSIKAGDELVLASGLGANVTAVSNVKLPGLYNPQTVHGDIVVDGVCASTYTTAVDAAVAHSMLSPLRAAYHAFGWTTSALNSGLDFASV